MEQAHEKHGPGKLIGKQLENSWNQSEGCWRLAWAAAIFVGNNNNKQQQQQQQQQQTTNNNNNNNNNNNITNDCILSPLIAITVPLITLFLL